MLRPVIIPIAATAIWAAPAVAQPHARVIDRAEYQDRLHAMWLGQCIANWTGLQTEAHCIEPPFYTDESWALKGFQFITHQDPWLADDDTDIEYVYLHLMHTAQRPLLTGEEIRDGWLLHMDPQYIWVSNHRAWTLMQRGITPPSTSFQAANGFCRAIDAQLTTEFFGAFAPGMLDRALELAELPIRTTAASHAAHASQFYMMLYALASEVDPNLSGRDKAIWLVEHARQWIPDSSKAADIVDLVLTDFLANPDINDWERTRDLIYTTFQQQAFQNGYQYRGWTESSVNFACGVMALLYGQCDYKRTVQIGTLSGWDSDNCTATLGGLLGLMLGTQQLKAQFPGQMFFSDRYDIERTRNNLPDYLPADPLAQDTLSAMAARMMPLIDQVVISAGGLVDPVQNTWTIPRIVPLRPQAFVPGWELSRRSANLRVKAQGGTVTAGSSIAGSPPQPPDVHGLGDPAFIANGYEHEFSGNDLLDAQRFFFSTRGGTHAPGQDVVLTIEYDREVDVRFVRFIEGDHFAEGGWFDNLSVQLRIGGIWTPVTAQPSQQLDSATPFQIIDLLLDSPVMASGVRISGAPGGAQPFITCLEFDAFARPSPLKALFTPRVP